MRLLVMAFFVWLASRLVKKARDQRRHHKLVRQLKDLGVYGGTVRVKSSKKRASSIRELSQQADGPVPFGYKTAWLAVQCGDPRQVAGAMHCRQLTPASWQTGLARCAQSGGGLFFSPALDGFVLVIGADLFSLAHRRKALEALAGQFPEVQYFASHRVSASCCWARYKAGRCVRAYCYEDGAVTWDEGPLTPEEQALGLADGEPAERAPGEEDVLDVAAAWSIDPRFERKIYPPAAGWVCNERKEHLQWDG